MSARYEANGWLKNAEEDDWEEGEIGNGSNTYGDDRFHSETLPDLIEQLMNFVGTADPEAVVLWNDEDGPGRVDITRYETDAGLGASEADMDAWKAGKRQLWYCTYTFTVEHVVRCKVAFAVLREVLPKADVA